MYQCRHTDKSPAIASSPKCLIDFCPSKFQNSIKGETYVNKFYRKHVIISLQCYLRGQRN